jgi:hypothetical protein
MISLADQIVFLFQRSSTIRIAANCSPPTHSPPLAPTITCLHCPEVLCTLLDQQLIIIQTQLRALQQSLHPKFRPACLIITRLVLVTCTLLGILHPSCHTLTCKPCIRQTRMNSIIMRPELVPNERNASSESAQKYSDES